MKFYLLIHFRINIKNCDGLTGEDQYQAGLSLKVHGKRKVGDFGVF